jgi:hypothetical protein
MRAFLTLLFVAACLVATSCGDFPPPTVLASLDLKPLDGETAPFDRNKVIESGSITDSDAFDANAIQAFLAKPPYGRSSFLETYQSNGLRAADAIVSAANQYRINPLVFLVYAEVLQGLIAAHTYRFPPERTEYLFRCGCTETKTCLPELAGLDRQVACFGQALRKALDEIKVGGRTAGGWGPDVASTTIDNMKVTPANDATAAIYDRTPRVNTNGDSGTWAFWKIWQIYAEALNYRERTNSTDGAWIGEACTSSAVCSAVEGGICADKYPGGLCTVKCDGTCPNAAAKAPTFCAKFPDGGYCLAKCNSEAEGACRQGYSCVNALGVAPGTSDHVCSPTGN